MATITLPVNSGTQQWTPPANCHVIDKIELWGPGGSGGKRTGARVTGGGAGAYNVINGPISVSSLLVAGTVPFQTGRGGAAQATANTAGNPGSAKTWFSAIGTYAADFGLGGLASGTGTTAGGAGGLVANCVPTTNAKAGGNGGTDSSVSGASGGGASPSASGAGVSAAAVSTGVAGAGATAPTSGGNGGAAAITTSNATGGSSPGGGGGAHNGATGNSGAGADGQIVLTYTPDPVSSIVIGVAVWLSSTAYIAGVLAQNNANAYLCITSGMSASSGGPTTTSSNITDGTAHWQYLCHADYTSPASWASGIPGSLTQPIVGQVLAPGSIDISTPAFTPYLSLTGHGTTPTNTITLTAFPGFGLKDVIGAGFFSPGSGFSTGFSSGFGNGGNAAQPGAFTPFAINFLAPVTPAGSVNYFDITDANVILDGLQFKDQGSSSSCTLIKTEAAASNFNIRNCIVDGYAQPAGASLLEINSQGLIDNSLVVDRQAAGNANPAIALNAGNGSHFVNNTLVKINGESGSTTTSINWTTTTGAIFRNNAIYGYANPFGSGVGGSATADHNVSSAASFVSSGLTVGAGNVTGTTAANQFVNPATDFRLLASANLIRAGVVDTTDIPAATDIVGHNRVEWDVGAFSLFVVATSASSVLPLVSVGLAVIAPPPFNAIGNIPAYTAVVTAGLSNNAHTAVATGVLHVVAIVAQGQSNPASCAAFLGERPESSDFSPDFGPYTFFYVLANAILSLNASAAVNLPTLAAVGFLNDVAAGSSAIPAIACVAATAIGSANIIGLGSINVAAVANMSSLTNASGTSNVDLGSLIRAGQEEQASATVSLGTVRAVGAAKQFDIISAVSVSLPAMVCVAAIGFSCSARVGLFSLAATATMTQAGQAIGRSSLLTITIPTPVQTQLQADPSASIFLLADGSGLILQADVPRQVTVTDATNVSSTSTLPPLAASVLAFLSDVATGADSIMTIAAVSAAGQADLAVGSASVVLAASGIAVQQRSATCLAALDSFQAVVTAGQSDTATSTDTLSLVAVGAALQVDQAHSATNVNLAVVVTAGQSSVSSGLAAISLAASGVASLTTPASAADPVFVLRAIIAMANPNPASCTASIPLVANGTASAANASATANPITMITVILALSEGYAIGRATFATMIDVAALGQSDPASATNSVMSLVPVAALSSNTNASATINQNLTVAASGGLQDVATCSAAITLHFVGTAGQSNTAAAAVNLENMSCVGFLMDAAQGRSTFSLGCVALITQNYPAGIAFEIANIGTLTATASMSSLTNASGLATVPAMALAGQLGQVANASGVASLPSVTAVATMTSLTDASATASVATLACSAFISSTFGFGGGTIMFSAAGTVGGNNQASALASLAVLAETNATLYVSPTEFEPGDQVIYWSA